MTYTREDARRWIEKGGACIYRYGYAYRGARARFIDDEEALRLLPRYSFGMGFCSLTFTMYEGQEVLEFNELSENDLL